MFNLSWNHTRTGKPMKAPFPTSGAAMVRVMMVRALFPDHPMNLNGKAV
jgi:hypothetical protein